MLTHTYECSAPPGWECTLRGDGARVVELRVTLAQRHRAYGMITCNGRRIARAHHAELVRDVGAVSTAVIATRIAHQAVNQPGMLPRMEQFERKARRQLDRDARHALLSDCIFTPTGLDAIAGPGVRIP